MSYLIPGKTVFRFTTKDHQEAVIRYPRWEDLDALLSYINVLSEEDIYLTFSGETVTKEGEMYYLTETFKSIERGDMVNLCCYINNILVGTCTISRDVQSRKRSYHIGIFGITVSKQFRRSGLGEQLARITIAEAQRTIVGLKLLILSVYSPNIAAQSLYKKLGFKTAGIVPKGVWYKGTYIDEIKMYLPLQEYML